MNNVRVTHRGKEMIQWFCKDEVCVGDPLYGNFNDSPLPLIAKSFKNRCLSDVLLGVSTVDVVTIDLTKHWSHAYSNVANKGNKILILCDGEIVIHRKYNKIPCNQPMYVSNNGKITWRKNKDCIGWTSSRQDKDGFVKVRIKVGK